MNTTEKVKITVEVTQEDIDKGISGSARNCPIALAIRRLLKPECNVYVAVDRIDFSMGYDALDIPTPQVAVGFILGFDFEHKAKPFSFTLELPSECLVKA